MIKSCQQKNESKERTQEQRNPDELHGELESTEIQRKIKLGVGWLQNGINILNPYNVKIMQATKLEGGKIESKVSRANQYVNQLNLKPNCAIYRTKTSTS